MKLTLFGLLSGCFLFSASAAPTQPATFQQFKIIAEDSLYKIEANKFLNNTSVALSACRKLQLANTLTPTEDFMLAEKLAVHSKQLFENGNYTSAIVCSSKSRELAVNTLATYSNQEKANKYASYPNEKTSYIEEILSNDNTTINYWIDQLD